MKTIVVVVVAGAVVVVVAGAVVVVVPGAVVVVVAGAVVVVEEAVVVVVCAWWQSLHVWPACSCAIADAAPWQVVQLDMLTFAAPGVSTPE